VPDPELVRAADELYDGELTTRGVSDVRPACRWLLKQLKATRPESYEEGVRRYEDQLIPQIAAGEVNPLDGWLGYGRWLGDQLFDGQLVSVDPTGRAADFGDVLPSGAMAIYLPPKDEQRAVLLASPLVPTEHQAAARALLCP
jgi:hypothetical protein